MSKQDHSFKVVNEHGETELETDSWVEASNRQFRLNAELSGVGYEPNVTLWVIEPNGDEYKIQVQD